MTWMVIIYFLIFWLILLIIQALLLFKNSLWGFNRINQQYERGDQNGNEYSHF